MRARRAAALAAALLLLAAAGARAAPHLRVARLPSPDTATGSPVLDVPYLSQSEELCGGAAVAMVFRYWGRDSLGAEAFAPLVDDSARGIRTGVLEQAVRSLGWRSLAFRGSLTDLRDQLRRGRPVIVLLRISRSRWHYVVVVGIGAGSVLVHDPAQAPFRRFAVSDFRRMWKASGRWSLLILPPPGAHAGEASAGSGVREGADRGAADSAEAGTCAGRVAGAVREARSGELETAARALSAARDACPDAPGPARELAGVRFRQRRWGEAVAAARRAHELQPGDAYTTGLLAASLYLDGHHEEALRTWNRLGEPRVSDLRVYGLRRVRYGVVSRRIDLPAGSVLTPGSLALARRRIEATPAFARTRVSWRPAGRGRADLEVAVFERRLLPGGLPGAAVLLAAGLPERSLRLATGSLAGGGEEWSASWRWWANRPRVALRLRAPDVAGLTGIWDAEGAWSRSAFRGVEGPSGTYATLREERWHAGLGVTSWATPDLRWHAGLSLDRWAGRGTGPGIAAGAELLEADDRVRAAASGRFWPGPAGAFGTARAELGWRSVTAPTGLVASARAGVAAASGRAPLDLWPGAGTGHARPALLRGHPLVDGGVITGAAFGRRLAWAGAEVTAWLPGPGPLASGAALFVDGARAWGRPAGGASPVEADVGAGLRLALPGAKARLRLDVAHGLRDGRNAVSLGWEGPWPGIAGGW